LRAGADFLPRPARFAFSKPAARDLPGSRTSAVALPTTGVAFGKTTNDRFVSLVTAGCAIWNIGFAFVFGLALHHALRRGWVKL